MNFLIRWLLHSWQSYKVGLKFSSVAPQHARPPCPSPTPGVHPNPCALCRWCHPTISFSVVLFSSHLQSFPASGSFLMSQFFVSGGQSIGASALSPSNEYSGPIFFRMDWLDLLAVQETLRVFSNTTVQKHHLLVLSFLYSPTHIHTWLLEKP